MVVREIGYFGDARLARNGALLLERMHARQSVCLRTLADDRAEQARFGRFQSNADVTVGEMVSSRALLTAAAAVGRHVLAVHDTSEINYQAQRRCKRSLGTVGNGTDVGLFVHPVLAVEAQSGECLGLDDARIWRRTTGKAADYRKLPIEDKESNRWLAAAGRAKAVLAGAALVTVVADREADIYEKWGSAVIAAERADKADLATAFRNRGHAHDEMGHNRRTIRDCDHAISLNPDDAEVFNKRGTS